MPGQGLPPVSQQKAIVSQAASRYGVRPDVLWGLYGTETSFGADLSTSSAGAVGPFQFEPATAKSLGVNPNDFRSAAFGAAKYLSQFKGRGTGGMLSAYNAGPAGGYQSGYVSKTLANARSWNGPQTPAQASSATSPKLPGTPGTPGGQKFDQAGFQAAQRNALVGNLVKTTTPSGAGPNPLFASGLLSTQAPNPADYTKTTPAVPGVPALPSAGGGKGKLGGFLPASAKLQMARIDQGQDIATNPGGPITAPGDGQVVAVKDNPGGFGFRYPVVRFTSGPLAGQSVYVGHAHSTLNAGDHFKAGQVIAKTGFGTAQEGNARTPGWAEIGLWGPGGPGDMTAGRKIAPYLK